MSVDGCDSSLRVWWNNLKLPLSDVSLVQRTSFEFSQHDVSCYMQLLFSQTHPRVNIISTHSHDPLHRLQLQRVFVTVQHLLQVIMSKGGKQKISSHLFNVFLFSQQTDHWGLKEEMQTCFLRPKLIRGCKGDPEIILFEVRNPVCKIWKPLKTELIKAG